MSTQDRVHEFIDDEIDRKTWPWWGKLILWCVLIMFALPSSCVVLTSFDDAEQERAIAENVRAKAELEAAEAEARVALETARLATMEKLIEQHGYGPVAARCAVEGWAMSDRDVCAQAEALHAAKAK